MTDLPPDPAGPDPGLGGLGRADLGAEQPGADVGGADPVSAPAEPSVPLPADLARHLDALGGQLVWRIGKDELSDDVIVRLGFASATPRFAHLSRLRSAGDAELQAALGEGRVVIEWVD